MNPTQNQATTENSAIVETERKLWSRPTVKPLGSLKAVVQLGQITSVTD